MEEISTSSSDTPAVSPTCKDPESGQSKDGTSRRWFKPVPGQHFCVFPSCSKRASFDVEGSSQVRYCKIHKLLEMVDVTSHRCEHAGCNTFPCYAMPGSRASFCVTHRSPGMVDVRSKKCVHPACNIQASFNIQGLHPRFCLHHKSESMVNVHK